MRQRCRIFTTILIVAACLFGGVIASPAQAADYPDKPVTLVVPFSPGGGTDILARLVGAEVEKVLGQPVVIENRPGASGAVGAEYVARQQPDGYHLIFGTSTTHAIAPIISKTRMAGILEKFVPVSEVAKSSLILAVPASSPIKTLDDYVKAAKAGTLTYGTFGIGSTPHLLGAMFAKETDTQMVHVPYKGSSPAVADVTGGHISSVFLTVAALSGSIKGGELRGLAVAGSGRLESFPDISTFAEAGYKGFDNAGWFGIFAPVGTPADVLGKISDAVAKAVKLEVVAKRFGELGLTPVGSSPEALQTDWDQSVELVKSILAKTNLKIQK
ncbi:MAG: tripartite tricarboxylate transporter substrate binding protein [Rhodospirillales bacterium]